MPVLLYGVLAITIGFLLLFFGIRLFRTVLATTGFIFGSLVTFIFLSNMRDQYEWGPHGDLYTFIACLAIGALGSLLSLSVWMVALVAVGALAGFGSAIYLLSWKIQWANSAVGRPAFIVCLTIVGGLMAIVYERAIVMVATSIVGAVLLSSGIDVFAMTGFNEALQMLVKNKTHSQLTLPMIFMLATCSFIALIGFLVQLFASSPSSADKKR